MSTLPRADKRTPCRRLVALSIGMSLFAPGLKSAPPGEWARVADLPEANGGFVCAAVDGEIVVAGGTNWQADVKLWLDGIWAYNPSRDAWRTFERLESPVAYAAGGNDAGAQCFAGGTSGKYTHRWLWRWELGPSVKRVAAIDAGLVHASGVLVSDKLYTIGGTDDQARLDHSTNAFRAIDLRTGQSERLADYPETGFIVGAAAACGDRIFVFGGARWDATNQQVMNLATANVYTLSTGRWSSLKPLSSSNRGISALALDETHILLAGGFKGDAEGFSSEVCVFEVKGGNYRATRPLPYEAMGMGLVKAGEWLYCMGGEDRRRHRTAVVYRIRWKDLLAAGP
ncbi:MAG: Kelch repeat-containing protein [Opitutaceae bacterium]